jgi:hypothetical protein
VRLGWAIVLGILAGALVVWWLGRDDASGASRAAAADAPGRSPAETGDPRGSGGTPALYRWRDDAGVLQLTDRPPQGRPYEAVDVDGLQRRNTFDPRDAAPAQ